MKQRNLFASLALLLAGCASTLPPTPTVLPQASCNCTPVESVAPKPAEKPLQIATWNDLPGWGGDDLVPAFDTFVASCKALARQTMWAPVCASAKSADRNNPRDWFEAQLQPWQLVNPDGSREGLITGYYEPIIKGSRKQSKLFPYPVFGPPDDLITVDLADIYPELKNMRLRGRIEGKKLVPYYSRAEWVNQEARHDKEVLLWAEDAVELFYMQIQGSGQVDLDTGQRIRVSYADQNGHPYKAIGRWLADQGEMKIEQASMQGIKAWAVANPKRLQQALNANPSMVFFREVPLTGVGPPGALGVALTPERSIAVDTRTMPLGSAVWLSTTRPGSEMPLQRLMLAQDTGGAIRGAVRADFYWGSGQAAGEMAGRMKQKGQMWVLLPKAYAPK